MKNNKTKILIVLVLIFIGRGLQSIGQNSLINPSSYSERIYVFTDRDVYFNNDDLYFSAILKNSLNNSTVDISKVLYIELLSFQGKVVYQGKFKIDEGKSSGVVHIPESISTGHYFISFYTKWMRNFSPAPCTYKPIKLINPLSSIEIATTIKPTQENEFSSPEKIKSPVKIKLNEDTVQRNTDVSIELKYFNDSVQPDLFIISVARESLIAENNFQLSRLITDSFNLQYLPETRGITISGHVKVNGQLKPDIKSNISLLGESEFSHSIKTDKKGRFYFSLPEYVGMRELYISASELHGNSEVFIDNDFCPNHQLPQFTVYHDSMKCPDLNNASLIHQINRQFYHKEFTPSGKIPNAINYYDEPTFTLEFENYIQLSTLTDYFHELIPQAGVRESEAGIKRFQVFGKSPDLNVYSPQVLLDGIIIDNTNALLAVNPRKIERIEIYNKPFIKGSNIYGGIIQIFSKDRDFAGFKFDNSGSFIKFRFYNSFDNVVMRTFQNETKISNTLFWSLEPSELNKKKTGFSFNTGENCGKFTISVMGFLNNKVFLTKKQFMIK